MLPFFLVFPEESDHFIAAISLKNVYVQKRAGFFCLTEVRFLPLVSLHFRKESALQEMKKTARFLM